MKELLHNWVLVGPLGHSVASFSDFKRAKEYADALLDLTGLVVAITHKDAYKRWAKTSPIHNQTRGVE